MKKLPIKEIENALKENRLALMEHESREVIASVGIDPGKYAIVNSADDAAKEAKKIGFPVVCKIASPDIIHKTDAGGIKLNLNSEAEVKQAFDEIMKNAKNYKADAKIVGMNIQPMVKEGITEVIIGMTTDPQFGPALMFGLGGIFVEIYKDVSFRVCPITEFDANEMIKEIKAFPLLDGFRGRPKADIKAIVDILMKLSKLSIENEEIDQIDLNPVIALPKGAAIVDARIILKEKK
ncbi:MAG: acetyl-CoA synthetase [Candidatus Lokiarchaeota archaeon]|nr:acetyl-CoA synthetase [Candidatus Lokiarchaeota archaeon]